MQFSLDPLHSVPRAKATVDRIHPACVSKSRPFNDNANTRHIS